MTAGTKNGALEWKFAGFTTTAPAWTLLSEFVVPRSVDAPDAKVGSTPAGPVAQADAIVAGRLHLLVGGYRVKQAAVEERRHELMSLAQGWNDDKNRLEKLMDLGKKAKSALRGRLYLAVIPRRVVLPKAVGPLQGLHPRPEGRAAPMRRAR
jgi:CRISPR system Cascade subunit CasA